MKCPHCSFDNNDDAAFCEKCGHVFLSSDRVPQVPTPAERERQRDAALTGVPPVLKVPDVVPPAPPAHPSVADMVEPLPDLPREPDFSGFERLVDSSYVPPAADAHAGDTAEIPVIRDEYVPRARSYTVGPSERELRRRERAQRRLAKKFEKQQAKEEKRAAKRAAKEAAAAARAEAKAAKGATGAAGDADAALEEAATATAAAVTVATVVPERPAETSALSPSSTGTMLTEDEVRAWKQGLGEGPLALGAPGLDAVMLTGDDVVSLFEKSQQRLAHRARPAEAAGAATAALELPGVEQGIVVAGERGIDVAGTTDAATGEDAGATSALAPLEGGEMAVRNEPAAASGTSELPLVRDTAPSAAAAPSASEKKDAAASKGTPIASDRVTDGPAAAAKASSSPVAATAAARANSRARRTKIIIVAAAVAAVLLAGAGTAAGTYAAELWGGKTIPDVVGRAQAEAEAMLAEKGFGCEAAEVVSDEPAGTVLSAVPEAGQRADEGTVITLDVAVPRTVPAVAGMTQQEAQDALAAAGYTAVEVAQQKSNEAEGTVLAVSPEAGAVARAGDPITLTVAVPFTVPDVAGMGQSDARAALEAEGYEVDVKQVYTEDVDEGTAVGTDPEAGTQLNSGEVVTLRIAKSRAAEVRELTASILPDAVLKTDDGSYKVEEVVSTSWRGYTDDGDGAEVGYKVKARKFEVVDLPFGLGQKTYYDPELTELEGGLVWNDDDKVSYADPAITY
ncbi:PASTA domain-containing protein [Adlercreutzia sp. R7]|uniref:PASTA domain-containing protein n=1 Tax=Adlercreutzia wanghongyangiae TaxID=3111451 RepID=A0ABU6IHP2_9ACTN|nr:PASTA domain-containing protein [Adlercreutzia sp. R7]